MVALLIIDGHCGFCRAAAAWVQRRSEAAPLLLVNQDPRLRPALAHSGSGAVLYWAHGRLYRGSAAVLRVCAGLRPPWRLLACGLGLPLHLREAVYAMIARHRSLLSRSCALPVTAAMDRTSPRVNTARAGE